jgi:hypothetical protein
MTYKKLRGLSSRTNYTIRATSTLSVKLVTTFAVRGCHVVSVTDPYGRILGFLDRITSPLINLKLKINLHYLHLADVKMFFNSFLFSKYFLLVEKWET